MNFDKKILIITILLALTAWIGYFTGTVTMLVPGFIHLFQLVHLIGFIARKTGKYE